ncbi:formate dehydrogenase accessory protein FdhE [Methylobacterium oryzihabitans]|uniref:Formate dehydrogenase accessory protein FdhE n=1 Tax=Methylobacterium oryzihabitans TaxID=2499852 RepID=A0A3S2VCN6_9HYPH|nr:formate dehydrogenase accessory protein FdhE [Methylobacterium oryzihabitans]RVU19675.1 formate dehydrogenase accessory protein FdhE [Methylobacterium oryzihabitans]
MARFFRRGADPAPETDPPSPAAKPRELKPDPDRIGISGSVPFVRLPVPDRLFAERARRLRDLARQGHALGAYLGFLAAVAEAQDAVQAAAAAIPVAVPADLDVRTGNGMPPLSSALVRDDPAFAALLDDLLARLDLSAAPEAARAARSSLRKATPEDRQDLALQVFEGAFPVDRMAECLFVAAGLQVGLARQAAALDARSLQPVADGVCPCCGGAPVASLIVGWTPADKARYLSCSLCGTLWNHVRIRCTACGEGGGISYYGLDEVSKDVQVETCTQCHGYLKHLHQHRDPALDPVADDVASYGLDLKIAEEGFRNVGLNPLLLH